MPRGRPKGSKNKLKFRRPENILEVLDHTLKKLLTHLDSGDISCAGQIAYVCGVALKAMEQADILKRLRRVEAFLEAQKQNNTGLKILPGGGTIIDINTPRSRSKV
jgi:hypothetical protein